MTLATFAPPQNPSVNSPKSMQPRVLKAGFGDGYVQRAADGLNHMPQSWELRWDALTADKADAIEGFFLATGGYQAFWYVPPDRLPGGAPLKFIVEKWIRTPTDGVNWSLSATVTQVFDL